METHEIELSPVEVIDDSFEDLEDQSSRWMNGELEEYVAVDIPDEDQEEEEEEEAEMDDQEGTEMGDQTRNSEAEQRETEREDEPLNSDEWLGENSSGIGSDQRRERRNYLSSWGSICRVPKHIREVDEKAFTPRFVSIGPFHYKNPNLLAMEILYHKQRLLNMLVEGNHCLHEKMRRAMEKIEPRARRYYSESFPDLSTMEFVEMMVVDGCFILQLFRLNYKIKKEKQHIHDPIFSNRWMLPYIGCDLLMIENQLPFIVLHVLHKLTSSPEEISLNELALEFLKWFHVGRNIIKLDKKFGVQGPHKHLLAFFQSVYAPSDSRTKSARLRANQQRRTNQTYRKLNLHPEGKNWVNNATKLQPLGIRFVAKQTGNLLDITFQGSTLGIPTLAIHGNNAIIVQNMLAYEQCSGDAKPNMTSLVMLLCSIAAVADDVKILREATILQHPPGDDQMVIDILKLLSKEIKCGINESVLFDQVVSINRYCQSPFVKLRSQYRNCGGPRVLGAFLAMIVIFLIKYLLGINVSVKRV